MYASQRDLNKEIFRSYCPPPSHRHGTRPSAVIFCFSWAGVRWQLIDQHGNHGDGAEEGGTREDEGEGAAVIFVALHLSPGRQRRDFLFDMYTSPA